MRLRVIFCKRLCVGFIDIRTQYGIKTRHIETASQATGTRKKIY